MKTIAVVIARVVLLVIVIALSIAGLLTPQLKNGPVELSLSGFKFGQGELKRSDIPCDELKTRLTAAFALNIVSIKACKLEQG